MKKLLISFITTLILSIFSIFAETKPNVIFLMADDLGIGDIAKLNKEHFGEKPVIQTPTMDKMIDDGILFTNAHSATALCSPTRYSTLTGNFIHRSGSEWGFWGSFTTPAISKDTMTIGNVMRNAGYQTAFLGKWHIGSDFYKEGSTEIYSSDVYGKSGGMDLRQIVDGGPFQRGFDYSLCLPAGIQNIPYNVYENSKWMPLGKDSVLKPLKWKDMPKGVQLGKKPGMGDSNWDPRIIGKLLADKTCEFIEKSVRETPEKPFFVTYFSQAVHHPHTPPEEYNGHKVKGTQGNKKAPHLDMIWELDLQIEQLIQCLKENGVYENTLFIITSDNGGMGENNHVPQTMASDHDSTNGLRSDKGSIYEGGHRVPTIAIWPGKIKGGTRVDAPILSHDIMATLYDLTDQDMPEDQALDSFSFLPHLQGDKDAPYRDKYIIQAAKENRHIAYYENNYKLIVRAVPTQRSNFGKNWATRENQKKEHINERPKEFIVEALFDMQQNPEELENQNLAKNPEYKVKVQQMLQGLWDMRNSKYSTPRL